MNLGATCRDNEVDQQPVFYYQIDPERSRT